MRKCSKCEITKPKTDFHKDKWDKDGIKTICKECYKEISKRFYKNVGQFRNKGKYKKQHKKRYEKKKKEYRKIKSNYGFGAGTISRFGFKLALEVYERADRKF